MTYDPRCWFGLHSWKQTAWPADLLDRLQARDWKADASSQFEICPRCASSRTLFGLRSGAAGKPQAVA